jgi:hypothetical protein
LPHQSFDVPTADDCHGNPERVPKPSRDGLRRAKLACAHAFRPADCAVAALRCSHTGVCSAPATRAAKPRGGRGGQSVASRAGEGAAKPRGQVAGWAGPSARRAFVIGPACRPALEGESGSARTETDLQTHAPAASLPVKVSR